MKKLIALFSILTFLGCKDKDSQSNQDPEAQQEIKVEQNDFFKVSIDLVAKKDDSFHVFYNEDKSGNFVEEKSVWCEFKGSYSSQTLNFNLPKNVLPNQLRFDFGVNKEQEEVKINNISITYLDKKFNISGVDMSKYFNPNESSTSLVGDILKPLSKGQNASVYPLEPLTIELEKLFK